MVKGCPTEVYQENLLTLARGSVSLAIKLNSDKARTEYF
jgi:hypothetical protein